MALYSYVKAKNSRRKKIAQIFSIVFIFSGMAIISWVTYPILSFELFYAPKFVKLISPIPSDVIAQNLNSEFSQVLGTSTTDYTKASVWFPKAINIKLATTTSSYSLSIPKLRIENATVLVGAEDLSKSLIHFTGPQPGNYGTPVIFGHSTIPWLYNPKDYKTIFSKLPDLVKGDKILITSDNITYTYQVTDMRVTTPDDLSVLEQDYNSASIALVTCVPPGTYLKRLIIKGKLIT